VSSARVGAVLIGVIAVVTYLAFTRDIPFVNDPYEVRAVFRDSSGIRPGSPVRIAGVDVGEVTGVERTAPGARTATLTMSVVDRGRPIHADATAKIRPRIFLEGNFYVELTAGTPAADELDEGEVIPADRTANPVQFDEVLKALKSDTRAKLRRTLIELGETQRAGGGEAFNRSLRYQPDAYYFSAIVSEALLGERPGDLARWLGAGGRVAAAIDRRPERLRSLITDFNRTAAALADREDDLRAAVDELPDTLDEALPTFAELNAAFPSVRRFAREVRPGVRSIAPASAELIPLLRQLRGLVGEPELRGLSRDLRASTPPLTSLAQDSVPVLEQLRQISSCTSEVLVPWGDLRVPDEAFPATGPIWQESPKAFSGLAGESRSFDANGQWFKVLGSGGTETFDLGGGLFGTASRNVTVNPPPDESRPPLRPDVPCETQEPPNLETNPQGPPRRVPIDPSAPAVQERVREAREIAAAALKAQLAAAGDTSTAVIDSPLTPAAVRDIARQTGLEQQLDRLPALVDQVPAP